MRDIVAVILAAGRGTRMKTDIPKVLHEILGKPILGHIIDSLGQAGVKDIITVAGYGSELIKKYASGTKIVVQKKLLGSGDAVLTAKKALGGYSGDVLVICGDTPLIKAGTIKALIARHKSSGASLTILTARLKDPTGYGRIVRRDGEKICKIAEDAEAGPPNRDHFARSRAGLYEEVINEINVGTYCFKACDLYAALSEVRPDNSKKEIFLTDTIGILHKTGKKIESVTTEDSGEAIGINTRKDLAYATRILKDSVLEELMASGVTIEDTASTVIYKNVKIGRDTVIRPNTVIESNVRIGKKCSIGPFARIRGGVDIGDNVEIGNFVELVRTRIADNTKVKHLTYLGDTTVGKDVNVGAGVITANFDGKNKNKTIIEDEASIGVGVRLIAPVKVGKRSIVGAGAVVPRNQNVPKGAVVVGVPARTIRTNEDRRQHKNERRKGKRR